MTGYPRFSRLGQEWTVSVPEDEAKEGDYVEVLKKDGELVPVILGALLSRVGRREHFTFEKTRLRSEEEAQR